MKAVDICDAAFQSMEERFGLHQNIEAETSSIEDLDMQPCHFVNAAFSLPFVKKELFDNSMSKVLSSVVKGGVFVGNFFGPNDDWQHLTLCSREKVEGLFTDFETVHIKEWEGREKPTVGGLKHWHVIWVIAQK